MLSARRRTVAFVAAGFLSIGAAPVSAQVTGTAAPVVRANADGTVSVSARDAALPAVIEELLPTCALDVRIDAKSAARVVTIDLADLEPAAAVSEVLRGAGLDFAMHTRCGTTAQPALVIVREPGGGPLVTLAPRRDWDDPAAKLEDLPSLPPAPLPEPETRDESDPAAMAVTLGSAGGGHERAPGEVTGAQLVERLATKPRATDALIELPFTDQNGQPYQQVRPVDADNFAVVPFPDANGNLVVVPIPKGPRPQTAGFPVYVPKSFNTSARRPGGGS